MEAVEGVGTDVENLPGQVNITGSVAVLVRQGDQPQAAWTGGIGDVNDVYLHRELRVTGSARLPRDVDAIARAVHGEHETARDIRSHSGEAGWVGDVNEMHTLITCGQAGSIAGDREIHEGAAAVPPRQRRRMGWVANGDAYQASAIIYHKYMRFLNARG